MPVAPEKPGSAPGEDINVEPVWAEGIMGTGINVVVVDDGMDYLHEDLSANVDTTLNHDYTGNNDVLTDDTDHGTSVAGIIAARDNTLGIRGVAPRATIYAYNLLQDLEWINEVDAMSRNHVVTAISSNSWGCDLTPRVGCNRGGKWTTEAEKGLSEGFHGKGILYVFGAGNNPTGGGHTNLSGYTNTYFVTTVCAVDKNGVRPTYSVPGDTLWVCAPAADVTLTNYDHYQAYFAGTSGATAVVSGVAALVREANSALTWRDVKLVLAGSARKNHPSNPGWQTGALKYDSATERYAFNREYGFGVVDAKAAVDAARNWENLPPLLRDSVASAEINANIADSDSSGDTTTHTYVLPLNTDIGFTEFVRLDTNFEHSRFRDLMVQLISPAGTVSTISHPHEVWHGTNLRVHFAFGSSKFLGENPNGIWTLQVTDHINDSIQTSKLPDRMILTQFSDWGITVYGHDSDHIPPAASVTAPAFTRVSPASGALEVEWIPPADNDGSAVTDYDLRYIRADAADKADAHWTVLHNVWTSGPLRYTVPGLVNGVSYEVQLRASNAAGTDLSWSRSITGTPQGNPGAPTINSTIPGNGEIAVSWLPPSTDGGSDIVAYDLRYIRDDATDRADAQWSLLYNAWLYKGALHRLLTGLENGAQYDVQVRAVNSIGHGSWSATAAATPTTAPQSHTTPEAPSTGTATPADQSLTVTWTPPANTGGAVITTYDIRYLRGAARDKSDDQWMLQNAVWTSGDLQHTINELANGVPYDVQVRAINAAGAGPWSATATGTPRTLPGTPMIASVSTGDQSLTVTWNEPAENGGATITSYDLRYIETSAVDKSDDRWTVRNAVWTLGALQRAVSGLTNGNQYGVQVRAVNEAGPGPWAPAVFATPTGPANIRPVAAVELSPSGSVAEGTAITVTMSFGNLEFNSDDTDADYMFRADVTGANQCEGAGIGNDRYMYQVDEDPEIRTGVIAASCPAGEYTLAATISSAQNVQLATASANFSVGTTTPTTQAPGHPSINTPITPGDGSLTVAWTAPADGGDTAIMAYDLRHIPSNAADQGDVHWTTLTSAWVSGNLQYDITGLSNGVSYNVQARAVNSAGAGPWSATATGTPVKTPAAPAIQRVSPGDQTAVIGWSAPADTGGGAITGYDLRHLRSDAADKSTPAWTVHQDIWSSGSLEYTAAGLTNGVQYDFQIRAASAAGAGPWSATATGRPQTVPGVPSLNLTTAGAQSLTLSWNAPADNGGAAITSYDLRHIRTAAADKADVQWTKRNGVWSAGTLQYVLTGLSGGVQYDVQIRAVNAAGAGPWSAAATGTPTTASSVTTATVTLSPSGNVTEGTPITVTMSFGNLEHDSDGSDTDYLFRADVVNADQCEENANGYGLGVDRRMNKVDEDPEVRHGTVSASCPVGSYTVRASISSADHAELASATVDFSIVATAEEEQTPGQTPTLSADATLSGLTLSGVDFGTFSAAATEYTASVANTVAQTTVIPTTNNDGATYEIKLGGVSDADSIIALSVGGNTITIEVTAEDGNTVKTYTVTVTRAEPPSTDATLNGLTLSGVDFGTFASDTTTYTASVANDVAQTQVVAVTNHAGAAYVVRLGSSVDADGAIALSVGENVITIKVTAEDESTVKTYTVTVTRAAAAPPSTPQQTNGQVTGPGAVNLDWEDVAYATGYQVALWKDPNQVPLPSQDMPNVEVEMEGSSATVTGLPTRWSHYWFQVRASNSAGTSDWSGWFSIANE